MSASTLDAIVIGTGQAGSPLAVRLTNAGEHGFIVVDDALRTNVEGIYAIGDCNGRGAYYEIVAANLLDGARRSVRDRITSYALFTDPLLARVGLTDTEIRRSGRRALFSTR